jgi:hypothetical protein
MQWSRLKALVESRLCDSLRGRLELHSTRYRGTHDDEGRAWITLDRKEIFSACSLTGWAEEARVARQLQAAGNCLDYRDPQQLPGYREACRQACEIVQRQGIHTQYQFYRALNDSLNLSVEDALASPNGLIRAFAIVDKRLGKRRLAQVVIGRDEHPLVRRLYEIRRLVEDESPSEQAV